MNQNYVGYITVSFWFYYFPRDEGIHCVCMENKAVPLIVIGFAEHNKEVMWGFNMIQKQRGLHVKAVV